MKYLNYIHFGLTLVIGIVVIFGLGQAPAPLGGVTNFDQLDAANPPSGGSAYTVSSTAVINAGGQWTGNGVRIGTAGTMIAKQVCNSRNYDAPSLAINGTTTIDVALTGATTTSAQVYTGTFGTSSLQYVVAGIGTTTTANYVTVTMINYGPTVDPATSTLAVCYSQF